MKLGQIAFLLFCFFVTVTPAQAYIGPGSGLSAIGALIALLAAVAVAFVGFVWYPLKRMRRKSRERAASGRAEHASLDAR